MKLMICANLGVGGLPAIDLPAEKIDEWEESRVRTLSLAVADGVSRGAEACVIAGGLFVRDFVAQSLVLSTMKAAGCHGIPVYYVPFPGELIGLGKRLPNAESVQLVMTCDDGEMRLSFGAQGFGLPIITGTGMESLSNTACPPGPVAIIRSGNDVDVSLNGGTEIVRIGPLAISAFGETRGSGYLLVDTDDERGSAEWIGLAVHPFVEREVIVDHPRNARVLVTTVGEAVSGIDRDACLRIVLKGRIPLDVYINVDELAAWLGRRFYYVEVADECELDVNADVLDLDISLLAEFVRSVTGDDSLSAAEKRRILRCGWNALNGKELAE